MNFSKITEDLFIGTTPSAADYSELYDLGVRLVINMRIERRPHKNRSGRPLDFLWLPSIDSPFFPIPVRNLVRGARAALATMREGGKVYAHCAGGVHRAVAMGAAILIAQGYRPQEAMGLIKSRRPFADPDIFYIHSRILRFAEEWDGSR